MRSIALVLDSGSMYPFRSSISPKTISFARDMTRKTGDPTEEDDRKPLIQMKGLVRGYRIVDKET